jgi:hypothetical protein
MDDEIMAHFHHEAEQSEMRASCARYEEVKEEPSIEMTESLGFQAELLSTLRPDAPAFDASHRSCYSQGSPPQYKTYFGGTMSSPISSVSSSLDSTPMGSTCNSPSRALGDINSQPSPTYFTPMSPPIVRNSRLPGPLGETYARVAAGDTLVSQDIRNLHSPLHTPMQSPLHTPMQSPSRNNIRSPEQMLNPQLVMVPGVGLRLVDVGVSSQSPNRLPPLPTRKAALANESADGYMYIVQFKRSFRPFSLSQYAPRVPYSLGKHMYICITS